MSWVWVLPASAVLGAVLVSAIVLRRVAAAAREVQVSLDGWHRMAVAIDDLQHDAQQVERNLRRLTRR